MKPNQNTQKKIVPDINIYIIILSLSGCGIDNSSDAHKAQRELVGIEVNTLYSCAGLPNAQQRLEDGSYIFEYYKNVYKLKQEKTNIFLGKSCIAIIRSRDNKIIQIHYSGDNDELFGKEGVCASILRTCLRK
ncbi:MAG: hypothetical protein LKE62_07880 [Acetobacter sp.]|jgi:hypothetical protein|nr:hypothetical protein [Acetobacter sp.]